MRGQWGAWECSYRWHLTIILDGFNTTSDYYSIPMHWRIKESHWVITSLSFSGNSREVLNIIQLPWSLINLIHHMIMGLTQSFMTIILSFSLSPLDYPSSYPDRHYPDNSAGIKLVLKGLEDSLYPQVALLRAQFLPVTQQFNLYVYHEVYSKNSITQYI